MTDLAQAIDCRSPSTTSPSRPTQGHEVVRRGEAREGPRPGARGPRPPRGRGHRRQPGSPSIPREPLKARGPRSLKVVALLSKPARRLVSVHVDYVASRSRTSSWSATASTTREVQEPERHRRLRGVTRPQVRSAPSPRSPGAILSRRASAAAHGGHRPRAAFRSVMWTSTSPQYSQRICRQARRAG